MPRAADWNTSDWNAPTATTVLAAPSARVRKPMSISAFHTSLVSAVPGVNVVVEPRVSVVANAGGEVVAMAAYRKNCQVGMTAVAVASPPIFSLRLLDLDPTLAK